jgi:hypothetical protein
MNSTFKISALVVAFAGFAFGAKAQTTTSTTSNSTTSHGVILSAGADAGIPTGSLSNGYNWNIGGSLQADFPVANKLFVTVNAGYNSFQGKDNAFGTGVTAPGIQLLPVKAGIKYFPVSHFYVQGEAGAAFALNKSEAGFNNGQAFIYAPQVGYQFPLGGRNFIDAGVRYEGSTDFTNNNSNTQVNFFALRVAYAFGTK